jgi:hypothetical protein
MEQTKEPVAGNVVSAGAVTTLSLSDFAKQQTKPEEENQSQQETPEEKSTREATEAADAEKYKGLTAEQITAKKSEEAATLAEAEKNKVPELTDDQLNEILKSRGITVEGGLEAIKNKLNPTPEATEAEKKDAETKKDLAAQAIYIKNGGTIEQFAMLKELANADEKELANSSLRAELKEAGIDEEDIDEAIRKRYFQLEKDIEQGEDESDGDFEKRKAKLEKLSKFGATKIENRGKTAKNKAATTLNNLYKSIETSDLQKREMEKEETEFSSKVDEISKTAPKKLTFSLGKDDKQVDIPAFEFEVKDEDIAAVVAELKDPAQRNNILYTEDDKLKADTLFDLRLKNRILEKAVQAAILEGGSRQSKLFKQIFPHQANELGIGGDKTKNNGQGQPGKIVSVGKPELMQRPTTT